MTAVPIGRNFSDNNLGYHQCKSCRYLLPSLTSLHFTPPLPRPVTCSSPAVSCGPTWTLGRPLVRCRQDVSLIIPTSAESGDWFVRTSLHLLILTDSDDESNLIILHLSHHLLYPSQPAVQQLAHDGYGHCYHLTSLAR